MLKDVFTGSGPQGPRFSIPTLSGWLTDTTREGLEAKYNNLVSKATKVIGRELSEHELRYGIKKPPLSQEKIAEALNARVQADRAKRLEDEAAHSPEAIRLKVAQERAEQERRGKLTHAERELEDATKAAQEAEQRKADKLKREEIKSTPAYKSLRQNLDDALIIARLDPSISQEQLDALVNQSEALERTADLPAVRSNLTVIQKAITDQTAIQDAELRKAVDCAELRQRMLATGQTWDSVDTEIIGDLTFVVLSANGQTKKVSQQTFDSRESDEALKASLFGEGATNV